MTEIEFVRGLTWSPAIVWDALTDDVLIDGWLALASVEPRIGGEYRLRWTDYTLAETIGVITEFVPLRRLVIDTDNIGTLDFTLSRGVGGPRDVITLLTLRISVLTDPRMLASTRAYWRSNLDQLEELLRGRPVDWSNWQNVRGPVWEEYLREESHGH